MIRVTEIAFTGYPVTDMPRARRFYEGLLGLSVSRTFGEGDRLWVEYDVGPATLAINNLDPSRWKPSSDGPGIALEVEDFAGAVQAVREAGARILVEPQDFGSCRLVVVADPDGNSVALHQRNTHNS